MTRAGDSRGWYSSSRLAECSGRTNFCTDRTVHYLGCAFIIRLKDQQLLQCDFMEVFKVLWSALGTLLRCVPHMLSCLNCLVLDHCCRFEAHKRLTDDHP